MEVALAYQLRIRLLGPVQVSFGDDPVDIGHARQTAVLAALALADSALVSADDLVEAVWGTDAPDSAVVTLRSYIYRLRRILEAATGHPLIDGSHGGYQLQRALTDAGEFRREATAGRTAMREHRPQDAIAVLTLGLARWSGSALAGVPGPYAAAQRTALGEQRLTATVDRLAGLVEVGRHTEAVEGLATLAVRHPMDEKVRSLLMIALSAAGRSADALREYRDIAGLLREELGLTASARLQAAHRAILQSVAC